ncbi:MAG TPA: hypothetical protein VFB62_05330 [Polyangiaceae bacterium]|jgi:hypothetical protein|nr:hypothetical protein [Polyangiaceae bacterium]
MAIARLSLCAALFTAACADPVLDPVSSASSSNSQGVGAGGPGGGAVSSGAGGEASGGGAGSTGAIGLDCESAPSALLCEDFEAGAIDEAKWSVVSNAGGSLTVDDVMAIDGDYALHVTLPPAAAAEGTLRLASDMVFPVAGNAFFGRAFVYVAGAVPDTHSRLIRARGKLADGEDAQYRLDCNNGKLNSRYYTPTINDLVHGGLRKFGYDVPADAWLCVEWHYDGEHDEMRYWIDGELIEGMTVLSTEEPPWVAPEFASFEIGWITFQAGNTQYDVFYDSIVLDSSRIGCGR